MTWNYRIVRYRDGQGYGLHEVHYDKDGNAWSMTTDPAGFVADAEEGPEIVIKALGMAMNDATTRGVFDEPDKWPGKPPGEDVP